MGEFGNNRNHFLFDYIGRKSVCGKLNSEWEVPVIVQTIELKLTYLSIKTVNGLNRKKREGFYSRFIYFIDYETFF